MWIDTESKTLPNGLEEALVEEGLTRTGKEDHVWINLDTGAVLVLACDGSWEEPEKSGYKVFLRPPVRDELLDVTFGLLGTRFANFDRSRRGIEVYEGVLGASVININNALDSTQAL